MKRVILIIADSMGCGEAPDAAAFGDAGSNTILHAAEGTPDFAIPNLRKLGITFGINSIRFMRPLQP